MLIDVVAASQHIELLTGDPNSEAVFQVVKHPNDAVLRWSPVYVGTLAQHLAALNRLNVDRRAAVYVQLNASVLNGIDRSTWHGKRPEVSGDVRIFVADDDGKRDPPELRLPPTAIVQTSAGDRKRHFYYKPQPGVPISSFKVGQQHLCGTLQTDPAVTKIDAQVMRLAGSWNWKTGTPFQVRFVEYNPTRIYSFAKLIEAHPSAELPKEERKKVEKARATLGDAASSNEEIAARRIAAKKIEAWLKRRKIEYTALDEFSFRLKRCPNNPEHRDTARIAAIRAGTRWGACFHETCGAGSFNIWKAFKEKIGGFDEDRNFGRGDHIEIARRALNVVAGASPEPIVFAEAAFHRYNLTNGLWEKIPDHVVGKVVHNFAGVTRGDPLKGRVLALRDPDVSGAVKVAAREARQDDFFAKAPSGIAFKNGFLRFKRTAIEFVGHSPENRARYGLGFDYDPQASCPSFLRYLNQCFVGESDIDQRIALLQEFLGACLVGEPCRYQMVLLLVGEGADGKSVFIDTAIALFPEGTCCAIKPQDLGIERNRAALAGKRLNAVSEIPDAEILAADSFKEVVDGKMVQARSLFKDPISIWPRAGNLFSANRLPATGDFTHAFFRRFRVIKWNRRFSEQEADRALAEKLVETEGPGIVAWAIEGARRLAARGYYCEPPSSRDAIDEWRGEVDSVVAFLRECVLIEGPLAEAGTFAKELFASYRVWARENAHRLMSAQTFARRMRSAGFPGHRFPSGVRYPVALREDAPRPDPLWN